MIVSKNIRRGDRELGLLNALRKKGLIKIKNFKKNPDKIRYLYLLTPRGITEKTNLTLNFMKRKLEEYSELEKEVENKD